MIDTPGSPDVVVRAKSCEKRRALGCVAGLMKLQIFSDFHIDVTPGFVPCIADGADVLVVAGDICQGIENGMSWLRRHVPAAIPIVVVAGNHEFYGRNRGRERAAGALAAKAHVVWLLDDGVIELGGVRFVGSTLWTDYDLYGAERRTTSMQYSARMLNDHALIQERPTAPRNFAPVDARIQHITSRRFLVAELAKPFAGPTVVVTHHAPHPGSVAPQFAGDPLTPAFVSDLGAVIDTHQPTLWVHGHTHAGFDYRVGGTRVVCNPLGYGDENPRFEPGLVVEV